MINMKTWAETVLKSNMRYAIPLMTHPGIEFTGRKTIDAVTNGNYHYEAIKAFHDCFHPAVAAVNMLMDLTVEAEAFGSKINFPDDEAPTVTERIVSDQNSIDKLPIPSLGAGRVPEYLKACRLASEHIKESPVFAGCIGPFSLAGRLFDLSEIMTAIFIEPDSIRILLQKCTQFVSNYVRELKNSGANGVIMAEPASGLLSADLSDEFSSKYIKEIVDDVQDDHFLVVLHNCGNTGHVTQSMLSTGAGALHLGNKINIIHALEEIPSHILVMGNLDPVNIFKLMNPEMVFEETMKLLEETSTYKNFIISTGCETPPGVPMNNVQAFFNAVNSFNNIYDSVDLMGVNPSRVELLSLI